MCGAFCEGGRDEAVNGEGDGRSVDDEGKGTVYLGRKRRPNGK